MEGAVVRKVTVAAVQFACSDSAEDNISVAERLVRSAHGKGANIILIQELFEGPYFCQAQREDFFRRAKPYKGNTTILKMQKIAKELGVVIPVSFFEEANNAHYNSIAIIDADGTDLGLYRKSHIPDGPGYQEKFYFNPGDTGFKDKVSQDFQPVYSDAQASFISEYKFDVSKLEPLVAKPHSPDNRALARECKNVRIDRVYIGSCTGGKTEDFVAAAKVFVASGNKVKVPTFLVPATQKVWMDIYTLPVPGSGGKTCSQIFEEAGCDVPTSPSCGACLGGPRDTYARMNEPQVCVSTTNRNFPGRMGHKEGQIYLASPYTAAASALTGYVTDPRDFLQ